MGKYILIITFLVIVLCSLSRAFSQETVTITTYYPSPSGVYSELIVSDRMSVGDVNGDGVVDANDLPHDSAGNPLHNALAVVNSLNNRLAVGDVNGDGALDAEDLGRDSSGNLLNGVLTVANSVGIGTNTPDGALDVRSVTGGFIPPRMNTADRNGLPRVAGTVIFNTDTGRLEVYDPNSGAWIALGGGVPQDITTVTSRGCWWGGGGHDLTATCPTGYTMLSCAGGPGDQQESNESYQLFPEPTLNRCRGYFREPACWGTEANQVVIAVCAR